MSALFTERELDAMATDDWKVSCALSGANQTARRQFAAEQDEGARSADATPEDGCDRHPHSLLDTRGER